MNNKKNLLIYYMAIIAAFVTTQAPFWVARKATAASEQTVTKRAPRTKKATATVAQTTTRTSRAPKGTESKMVVASTKAHKPYKAISSSVYTFDPVRNILLCEHGEGLILELPVTLKAYSGNPLDYVARLPKSKNALCGLPVTKKGEKSADGTAHQCGLVIDETRLSEASIVMGDKLKSLKPKHAKATTVAQATPATTVIQ